MKNYSINNQILVLKTTKSPFIIRIVLYLITFLSGFLPILGFIYSLSYGDGIKIYNLISLGIFGLISFYMLRVSLWNTYGLEKISIKNKRIEYYADYGWFKDNKKSYEINNPNFEKLKVGYENENKAVLIIRNGENIIQTVTKQPESDLEEIINEIKNWC